MISTKHHIYYLETGRIYRASNSQFDSSTTKLNVPSTRSHLVHVDAPMTEGACKDADKCAARRPHFAKTLLLTFERSFCQGHSSKPTWRPLMHDGQALRVSINNKGTGPFKLVLFVQMVRSKFVVAVTGY